MELKIYFNTQFVILTDCKITKKSAEYYTCTNKTDIINAIALIQNGEKESVMLFHENYNELFTLFSSCFRYIEAAGGLVQNELQEYLCMIRLGVWDLPKGKIDKGESTQQAAIREVQEETGLQQVELGEYICSTWHTYPHKKGDVLKQTFWYKMNAPKDQKIQPQTEENILELKWVAENELPLILANTYPSIIDVFNTI